MEDTKKYLENARKMMQEDFLDKAEYSRMESYVLRNGSRLHEDKDYKELRALLDTLAERHHLPTLASQQERFGLNSCAQ